MKIEVEITDELLARAVNAAVREYVWNNQVMREAVRDHINKMVADATYEVMKEQPEKLAKLVMNELKEVLKESEQYRDGY